VSLLALHPSNTITFEVRKCRRLLSVAYRNQKAA